MIRKHIYLYTLTFRFTQVSHGNFMDRGVLLNRENSFFCKWFATGYFGVKICTAQKFKVHSIRR